jgi:cell division protein ZapA
MGDPVTIQILGRKYKLRCRPEERELLIRAAERLDAEMQAIRAVAKTLSSDQVAIMAALNLVHELVQLQAQYADLQNRLNQQISNLSQLVDELLDQQENTSNQS